MFRCQRCGENSKKYEPCNKVVAGKRDMVYNYTIVEEKRFDKNKVEIIAKKASEIVLSPGQKIKREFQTKGWEIVKELKLCSQCLAEVEALNLRKN